MPVTMRWLDDERRIYLAEYIGAWTWHELFQQTHCAEREFDTLDYVVHVIHDFTRTTQYPPNILSQSVSLARNMHPNTGIGVLVGTGNFFHTLLNIMSNVYEATFHENLFKVAHNIDEARDLLQELMSDEQPTANV